MPRKSGRARMPKHPIVLDTEAHLHPADGGPFAYGQVFIEVWVEVRRPQILMSAAYQKMSLIANRPVRAFLDELNRERDVKRVLVRKESVDIGRVGPAEWQEGYNA